MIRITVYHKSAENAKNLCEKEGGTKDTGIYTSNVFLGYRISAKRHETGYPEHSIQRIDTFTSIFMLILGVLAMPQCNLVLFWYLKREKDSMDTSVGIFWKISP